MDSHIIEEIHNLGGDATEPEWEWLLKRGPHGNDFSWGQTKNEPPGYVGVEHLRSIVESKIEDEPEFLEKIKIVVGKALQSTNANILRRGIQVASLVGGKQELEKINTLTSSEQQAVANDARASVFLLKTKIKRQNS